MAVINICGDFWAPQNQVYSPNSNAEEAEVEWFYEDL